MSGFRHVIAACIAVAATTRAQAADTIVYDDVTGNYVLTYACEGEGTITTTLEPHNKLAPAIDSAFSESREGVSYSYTVSLSSQSRQPLRMIALDPILPVAGIAPPPTEALLEGASREDLAKLRGAAVASAPAGWLTIHFANLGGTTRVGWGRLERTQSTFVAGSSQKGFGFSSQHLPGVFPAEFHGDGAGWTLPCEGPNAGSVADALEALLRNDYVPRYAAAPTIQVDEPFNPIAILKSVLKHTTQLEQWGLVEASVAGKVRTHALAAIGKLQDGDAVQALVALRTLRGEIRRNQPDSPARAAPPTSVPRHPVSEMKKMNTDYDRELAIRVLDFDIAYVARRLGGKP